MKKGNFQIFLTLWCPSRRRVDFFVCPALISFKAKTFAYAQQGQFRVPKDNDSPLNYCQWGQSAPLPLLKNVLPAD